MGKGKHIKYGEYSLQEIESLLKELVLTNLDTPKIPLIKTEGKVKKGTPLKITIDNHQIYALSDRYKLFFSKGTTCVCCGAEADHWKLEGNENDGQPHLNLYARKKNGKIVLMTKDHILAKSKGGKNTLSNYQQMCEDCNKAKGDR